MAAVGHHGRAEVRGHCQGSQGGHRALASPQGDTHLPQAGTITAVKQVCKQHQGKAQAWREQSSDTAGKVLSSGSSRREGQADPTVCPSDVPEEVAGTG